MLSRDLYGRRRIRYVLIQDSQLDVAAGRHGRPLNEETKKPPSSLWALWTGGVGSSRSERPAPAVQGPVGDAQHRSHRLMTVVRRPLGRQCPQACSPVRRARVPHLDIAPRHQARSPPTWLQTVALRSEWLAPPLRPRSIISAHLLKWSTADSEASLWTVPEVWTTHVVTRAFERLPSSSTPPWTADSVARSASSLAACPHCPQARRRFFFSL